MTKAITKMFWTSPSDSNRHMLLLQPHVSVAACGCQDIQKKKKKKKLWVETLLLLIKSPLRCCRCLIKMSPGASLQKLSRYPQLGGDPGADPEVTGGVIYISFGLWALWYLSSGTGKSWRKGHSKYQARPALAGWCRTNERGYLKFLSGNFGLHSEFSKTGRTAAHKTH